jgi:hypothetical protein
MKGRMMLIVASALLLAGCASLPTAGRALSGARAYLATEEGRRIFPGASAGEPILVREGEGEGEGLHAFLVPLVSGGLVMGYGESFPGETPFAATPLDLPRRSLLRVTREEALTWAVESTKKRGPFYGSVVDGPHLIYREPRGYSWAVRFMLPGGPIVYSGQTMVIVTKAF